MSQSTECLGSVVRLAMFYCGSYILGVSISHCWHPWHIKCNMLYTWLTAILYTSQWPHVSLQNWIIESLSSRDSIGDTSIGLQFYKISNKYLIKCIFRIPVGRNFFRTSSMFRRHMRGRWKSIWMKSCNIDYFFYLYYCYRLWPFPGVITIIITIIIICSIIIINIITCPSLSGDNSNIGRNCCADLRKCFCMFSATIYKSCRSHFIFT